MQRFGFAEKNEIPKQVRDDNDIPYLLKKFLVILAVVPLILWGIWISFPASSVKSVVENSMSERFSPEMEGLKKGLFYNLDIDTIRLKKNDRELLVIRDVRCRINPLYLFTMRLNASVSGNIGKGGISGLITLSGKRAQTDLDFRGVDLKEIPLFKALGIRGEGTILGELLLTDEEGRAQFSTENARFETAEFSGVIVPLNLFNSAKGLLDITGNVIRVISLSLEGKDIHARLKGIIKDADVDLRMELMPEKSFLENPFSLVHLEQYMVSPGYYVVPIKGKLALQ